MSRFSFPVSSEQWSKAFAATVLAVGAILLLAHVLSEGVMHDEEQYIFAGLLGVDHSLYSDFIYLQTPYLPLLLSAVFAPLDGYYFAAARIVVWVFVAGSMILTFLLGRRITASVYAAVALATLFGCSTLLLYAFRWARNDLMPCFFMLLGLWILHHAERSSERLTDDRGERIRISLLYGLCGLSVMAAAGTKISYAFLPAVIFAFLLLPSAPSFLDQARRRILPYLLGVIIGACPIIYFALTRWDQFFYQIIVFHLNVNPEWYTRIGIADTLRLGYRLREALLLLNRDVVIAGAIFVAFISIAALLKNRSLNFHREQRKSFVVLVLALLGAALVFSILPKPSFPQYFVPVVPLLILLVACSFRIAATVAPAVRGPLLAAVTLVAMVPGLAILAKDLATLVTGAAAVQRVHSAAVAVRRAMRAAGVSGKVATLSPIRIIDGGLSVYPEFSSGPFFFRMADALDAKTVRAQNGMSATMLLEFLDRDPPAAILTGFESNRYGKKHRPDAAFEDYAALRGYKPVSGDFDGGKLFLRPSK